MSGPIRLFLYAVLMITVVDALAMIDSVWATVAVGIAFGLSPEPVYRWVTQPERDAKSPSDKSTSSP